MRQSRTFHTLANGPKSGVQFRPQAQLGVTTPRTLLQDLANLTRNHVRFGDAHPTTILARPTPSQTRAFELLNLKIAA